MNDTKCNCSIIMAHQFVHHLKKNGGAKKINKMTGAKMIAESSDTTISKIPDEMKCAPNKEFKEGSCFTVDSLKYLIKAWNDMALKKKGGKKIFIEINDQDTKKDLLIKILNVFPECNGNQICLLSKRHIFRELPQDVQDDIFKLTFRPSGPNKPDKNGNYEWLSTLHIDAVMEQYEKRFPDFKFLGAIPSDWDDKEVDDALRNESDISLQDPKFYQKLVGKGIKKIGVIFNMDDHNNSGSHWVAFYADLNGKHKGDMFYFDSIGHPIKSNGIHARKPPKFISRFIDNLEKNYYHPHHINKTNPRFNLYNHQQGDSECGVYSLNSIIKILENDGNFEILDQEIERDDKMHKKRRELFIGNVV